MLSQRVQPVREASGQLGLEGRRWNGACCMALYCSPGSHTCPSHTGSHVHFDLEVRVPGGLRPGAGVSGPLAAEPACVRWPGQRSIEVC